MTSAAATTGSSGPRILFIQGMRGFAMFFVFLLHNTVQFNAGYLPSAGFTRDFSSLAYTLTPASVDLFFLISGYLAYAGLMRTPRPYAQYVARRLRRLYPVYLVMLGVYVGLSLVFPEESKFPPGLVASAVYLVQNLLMLPGIFNIQPIMSVSWMMSYELFWVLILPLLLAGLQLRRWSRPARVAFWIGLTAGGIGLFIVCGGPVRLVMFIAGFLLHELLDYGYAKPLPPLSGFAALSLMCVILALLPVTRVGGAARMVVLFASLFIFCLDPFLRPDGPAAKTFSHPALVRFGDISYSFFLTHGLVIKAAFWAASRLFPPTGGARDLVLFWIFPLATFIPALVAARIIHRFVEQPFAPLSPSPRPAPSVIQKT